MVCKVIFTLCRSHGAIGRVTLSPRPTVPREESRGCTTLGRSFRALQKNSVLVPLGTRGARAPHLCSAHLLLEYPDDLKLSNSYFTKKTGLFVNSKDSHFRTCSLLELQAPPGNRGEEHFLRRERGIGKGCYKQRAYWRKLGVWSVVAFHWLSGEGLSLAGLLLGK